MWTKKEVQKFLINNPINTDGALGVYRYSRIKTVDDGDVYHRVIFPLWSSNDSAVKSLFTLVLKAIEIGNVRISTERCGIKIYFNEHFCDPD